MNMFEKVLVLDRVSRNFGSRRGPSYRALRDVSFSVESGEFVGIMGPSGAGKSTLLNIIATIDQPSSGDVYLDSQSLGRLKGGVLANLRRDRLGFVFQDHNLLDSLTLRENILLPLSLQGIEGEEANRRVEEVASRLGIREHLDKYPAENSGGQRQRTAIARAVVGAPSLLLADEPTGALDSRNSREIMATFADLQHRDGATILLVTHDPLVASYCSRILFLKDGQLFNEIRAIRDRNQFYRQIVNVLAAMEGAKNEVFETGLA